MTCTLDEHPWEPWYDVRCPARLIKVLRTAVLLDYDVVAETVVSGPASWLLITIRNPGTSFKLTMSRTQDQGYWRVGEASWCDTEGEHRIPYMSHLIEWMEDYAV